MANATEEEKEQFRKDAIEWAKKNNITDNEQLAEYLYWCGVNINTHKQALDSFGKQMIEESEIIKSQVDQALKILNEAKELYKTIDKWLQEDGKKD